jgi:6-phospho-beta-glucosidase
MATVRCTRSTSRNDATLVGLAGDDVVEVPARVSGDRIEPLEQAPLAPELLGLVQHVAAYERLTAQAAVTGELETARKALLAHPLIAQWDLTNELLERLLEEATV